MILPAVTVAMFIAVFSATAARGGILLPEQVGFSAADIDRSLESSSTAGSTSTGEHSSQNLPATDRDEKSNPLGLLKSTLPTSNSSSSSSSSAGGIGSGSVVCLLNATIALQDDASLGQLAEDHGLSLPEPPGTDLLRPPRA